MISIHNVFFVIDHGILYTLFIRILAFLIVFLSCNVDETTVMWTCIGPQDYFRLISRYIYCLHTIQSFANIWAQMVSTGRCRYKNIYTPGLPSESQERDKLVLFTFSYERMRVFYDISSITQPRSTTCLRCKKPETAVTRRDVGEVGASTVIGPFRYWFCGL